MKRLLLEPDCTALEHALLSSVDLDEPPPYALERTRAAVAREEETAIVPAVAARRTDAARSKYARVVVVALLLPLAAGLVFVIGGWAKQQEEVRRDPSIPTADLSPIPPIPPAPIAPTPPDPPALETLVPAASPSHVASPVVARPPVASAPAPSLDCDPPFWFDAQGAKHYKPRCFNGTAAPAPSPSVPAPTAPVAAPKAEFDRGAAAAALAAVDLSACSGFDGPDGTGHVTVTFVSDGTAASAVVDGGPFVATPRGGCAAAKFRAVVVPAFTGPPVRVGKSFSIP
ncbi:MAG: hypothetical protein KIT84_34855 [Labilithrix sp.]|nr:hypothetical protein [Labilithrix sp.]MCW5816230.1 hypothetical protein [Labilithrix sp.]